MDLFVFDFDNTLYAYNAMRRLPAQSRSSGVSQYHLASTWWVPGYERRAESGEWPTTQEYLDQFAAVTGARLTVDEWINARREASTPTAEMVGLLTRLSAVGSVAVLSNNPSPFAENLHRLAPDVSDIVRGNVAVSCQLGSRKPDESAFRAALNRFGQSATNTFFVDDSRDNVEGARNLGITAHHFRGPSPASMQRLMDALDAFTSRTS